MSQMIESDEHARPSRLIDSHLEGEDGEKHTMAPRRGEAANELRPENFERVPLSEAGLRAHELQIWWAGLPWWRKMFCWFWYVERREMEWQIGPVAGWGRERVDERLRPLNDPMPWIAVIIVVIALVLIVMAAIH